MESQLRRTSPFAAIAVAFVVVVAATALAQSSSSDVGTWKINFEKTKAVTGDKDFTSFGTTIVNEAAGAGVKCAVAVVSPKDGTLRRWEFSANYDGKDNAVEGHSQYGDLVVLTRVNANTTRYIYKWAGKATVTQTAVVSSDGKTMTVSSTGTDIQANPVNGVAVYDRQ